MRYELRHTRHGVMLYDLDDTWVGRCLAEMGEYSWREVEDLCAMARPEWVVLEAGAHIGAITVPLAKRVARVFAFEPQRLCFQMLCANLALNGVANVVALPEAIGREDGGVLVPVPKAEGKQNTGGVSLVGVTEGEAALQRSVDSLGLPRLDLLKADVEDMELDVLVGARETIRRCRPVLYLESNKDHDPLLTELERLGYRAWWHFPALLVEERSGQNHLIVSMNLLAVPRETSCPIEGLEEARRGDTCMAAAERERQRRVKEAA